VRLVTLRCLLVWLLAALVSAPAQSATPSNPSPELSPGDVVRIQLEALQHNDLPEPDAGIALAFRFSSPGNREQTGPLPRFSEMIRSAYAEMLNHREVRLPAPLIQGDEAIQPVEVVAKNGATFRYLFILSRQSEPPYAGCWMTDSVLTDPDQAPLPPQETI
jgi:hypothetical protein